MAEFCAPMVYAVFVWWFTTGIIWLLDSLPKATFRWSMTGATLVLLAAAFVLHTSAAETGVRGAYLAFSCAILIWGWLEMSFLMGFITGARTHGCAERCAGWAHFLHATQAIIYNELATLAGAVGIFCMTYRAPNRVALWTYLILWSMRLSAKLNLFLGVPNCGEKFLPAHLQYLKSFFRKRPMNLLFPMSIVASTLVTVVLIRNGWASTHAFQRVGYALEASLLMLAVLEHWFMVLPLPSEKLWIWAFKAPGEGRGRDGMENRLAAKAPYHP